MSLFTSKKTPQPQIITSVSYPQRTHVLVREQSVASKPKNRKLLPAFGVITVLVVGGFIFRGQSDSDASVKGTSSSEMAASEPEEVKSLDFTAMSTAINDTIALYPYMDIGVAVVDIETGDSQSYGVENPFVAASTAKLITALSFLQDVEAGKDTLAEPVGARTAQEALKAMIIDSDNVAWNEFNNTVMNHEELAAYATSVGLTNYDPDENTITPASVAKLLSTFYKEKLLNHEHTQMLLSYMAQAKEVEFITNTVLAGTKVFHKPGYLEDRVHDAAIIDNGSRPYALVIFTKSRSKGYNMTQGEDIFKKITLATLSTFKQ